jgi:hypothetical protein
MGRRFDEQTLVGYERDDGWQLRALVKVMGPAKEM